MIKLTLFDIQDSNKNDDVFVNINNISYLTRYVPYPWTMIYFVDGTKIAVKQSCEQILKAIKEFKIEV